MYSIRCEKPNGGVARQERGYTMIEIVMAMLVGIVLTVMAAPQVKTVVNNYRLNSAVAMSKWAIQSTRFQALEKGYPYQVVFNAANQNYQIQNEAPPAVAYSNVGSTVPLAAWPMAVSGNTTITFQPNGFVTSAPTNSFTITYKNTTATITVSNYGNVTTACSNTIINPTC
jgi:Tfp pilus assembly protein FimT